MGITSEPVNRIGGAAFLTPSSLRLLAVSLLLFLTVACAGAPPAPTTPAVAHVWPLPPDPPRIEYVRDLTQPESAQKPKGFFTRLFERIVGKDSETPVRMIRPFALFTDDKGTLFVTDMGLQAVHRFSTDGSYRQFFRLDQGRRLLSPTGVAEDADGQLYVADSQLNRVLVFDRDGAYQREFASDGDAVRISGIAYHPKRDALFVSDAGGHKILVFARDGRKISQFGSRGPDAGQFNFPTHLAVDRSGLLYVTDAMNFRVQVLDADGRWVRSIGQLGATLGSFSKPKGVGLDRHGNVYVVDGLYDTVQIFNPTGELLMNFGNAGITEGAFWLPTGVAVDGQDRIYVADTYNARVQVFRLLDVSTTETPAPQASLSP
jgi:DNA-binding beta-propeller fold protein YncE